MNPSKESLREAVTYVAVLPVSSRQFEVGRVLLTSPISRWPLFLANIRALFRKNSPEYMTATAVEQILRGAEVSA